MIFFPPASVKRRSPLQLRAFWCWWGWLLPEKNPLFEKKYSTVHTPPRFFLVQPDHVALQSHTPLWSVCTYTPPCPWRWLRCVGRSGFIWCFWGGAERWITAWKFFVLSFSSEWQEEGHKIWNIFLLFSLRVLLELVGPVISNYLRQRHSKSLGNKFCNNNKPLIVTKNLLFI